MPDTPRSFTDIELAVLGLLAKEWWIQNAQGPMKTNSTLVGPAGERRPMARAMMARFRDAGIISYVAGSPCLARITQHGRRLAQRLGGAQATA